MSERGDVAVKVRGEAVEEALTDHHLAEIAEMIEQTHGDTPLSETLSGNRPVNGRSPSDSAPVRIPPRS